MSTTTTARCRRIMSRILQTAKMATAATFGARSGRSLAIPRRWSEVIAEALDHFRQ